MPYWHVCIVAVGIAVGIVVSGVGGGGAAAGVVCCD